MVGEDVGGDAFDDLEEGWNPSHRDVGTSMTGDVLRRQPFASGPGPKSRRARACQAGPATSAAIPEHPLTRGGGRLSSGLGLGRRPVRQDEEDLARELMGAPTTRSVGIQLPSFQGARHRARSASPPTRPTRHVAASTPSSRPRTSTRAQLPAWARWQGGAGVRGSLTEASARRIWETARDHAAMQEARRRQIPRVRKLPPPKPRWISPVSHARLSGGVLPPRRPRPKSIEPEFHDVDLAIRREARHRIAKRQAAHSQPPASWGRALAAGSRQARPAPQPSAERSAERLRRTNQEQTIAIVGPGAAGANREGDEAGDEDEDHFAENPAGQSAIEAAESLLRGCALPPGLGRRNGQTRSPRGKAIGRRGRRAARHRGKGMHSSHRALRATAPCAPPISQAPWRVVRWPS